MTLYLEATTTIPDLFIDYIEVRLASGESASLRRMHWYPFRRCGVKIDVLWNLRMDNTDAHKTKYKEERLYMSTNQNLMQHMMPFLWMQDIPPTAGGSGFIFVLRISPLCPQRMWS